MSLNDPTPWGRWQRWRSWFSQPGNVGRATWLLVSLYVVLLYIRGPMFEVGDRISTTGIFSGAGVDLLLRSLVAIIIAAGLSLVYGLGPRILSLGMGEKVSKPDPESTGTAAGTPGEAATTEEDPKDPELRFPHQTTVAVGAWLVIFSVIFLVALVQLLSPSEGVAARLPGLVCVSDDNCPEIHYVAVTMVSAGIGAMISTILGYLEHAAEKGDFKVRYVPWYFARPLLGLLLGAVFFFMLKGGLLATVGPVASRDLNKFGLGAVGALVGLFSKHAIEKLREVFDVLFRVDPKNKAKPAGSTTGPAPESPTGAPSRRNG